MYYKLNFELKTFGLNKTVYAVAIADDEKQMKTFIDGYKQVTKKCEIFKNEIKTIGNTTITTITKIK